MDKVTLEQAIDIMTDGEGDTVTFCCKNPDFNGLPNECVIVNASWTDWQDRAFRADTREECLAMAIRALRVATGLEAATPDEQRASMEQGS